MVNVPQYEMTKKRFEDIEKSMEFKGFIELSGVYLSTQRASVSVNTYYYHTYDDGAPNGLTIPSNGIIFKCTSVHDSGTNWNHAVQIDYKYIKERVSKETMNCKVPIKEYEGLMYPYLSENTFLKNKKYKLEVAVSGASCSKKSYAVTGIFRNPSPQDDFLKFYWTPNETILFDSSYPRDIRIVPIFSTIKEIV